MIEVLDRAFLRRSAVLPYSSDDLRLVAAHLLERASDLIKLADNTDRMLRAENEDRGADRERKAIAAVALGRVSHEVAARVPLEAITGGPRLLAWTCALRSLRILGRKSRFWSARWCLGVAPTHELGLEREDELDLVFEAGRELDRAEDLGGSRGDVEALGTLIDVRARLVESELVDVLGAIGRGAPLLETGERLRAALRVWEG